MIAKLIVYGKDRQEAIRRMARAIDEFIIEGVKTTIPFHKRLLSNPHFLEGRYTTSLVEELSNRNSASQYEEVSERREI